MGLEAWSDHPQHALAWLAQRGHVTLEIIDGKPIIRAAGSMNQSLATAIDSAKQALLAAMLEPDPPDGLLPPSIFDWPWRLQVWLGEMMNWFGVAGARNGRERDAIRRQAVNYCRGAYYRASLPRVTDDGRALRLPSLAQVYDALTHDRPLPAPEPCNCGKPHAGVYLSAVP